VYNGGCSSVLTCLGREEPKSYVHADVAVGEVLVPCSCDVVAIGGALKPCRSTAVGAVVTEHAGCHHYLFYRGEPDGTPVLFPVA
jgi:hypothetical protein